MGAEIGDILCGADPESIAQAMIGLTQSQRAHNSAVECHLHTVEVVGSNPAAPTIKSTTYKRFREVVGSKCSIHHLRACAAGEHCIDRPYHLLHARGQLLPEERTEEAWNSVLKA
jgi:hypothetical protein